MKIDKFEFVKGCPTVRARAHVEITHHRTNGRQPRPDMYFICRGCEERVHLSDQVVDMALGNSLRVSCPGCKKLYVLGPCRDVSVSELL